jgi:hypothetical protein
MLVSFAMWLRYIFEEKELKGKVSASSKDSTVDVKKHTPKSAVIARLQVNVPLYSLLLSHPLCCAILFMCYCVQNGYGACSTIRLLGALH